MTKRVALRLSRGPEASPLAHREVIALLTDALRRSGLPLALTEGSDRRPRFTLVGALPAGYTSDAEWLELALAQFVPPDQVLDAVGATLPAGFRALEARRLPPRNPSLQSQLRWAEYEITFGPALSTSEIERAVKRFFDRPDFPWEEVIESKTKRFDLLALTDDLSVEESGCGATLGMRLDAASNGSGRPESVLRGLGLGEPISRRRTRLIFSHLPQALVLWRRAGRFENSRPER